MTKMLFKLAEEKSNVRGQRNMYTKKAIKILQRRTPEFMKTPAEFFSSMTVKHNERNSPDIL